MTSLPLRHETPRGARPVAAPGAPDLDEQIVEAERAVIERDERVQLRARRLLERGQRIADRVHQNFGRALGLGVAVGAGTLLATRLVPYWRDHRHQGSVQGLPHLTNAELAPAQSRDAPAAGRAGRQEMPWASVLALAWPFMPRAVRAKLNPRLAAFLVSLGLPLVAKARRPARPVGVVRSAPHVDLQRFAGRWYEIARFPERSESDCIGNVTAQYVLRPGPEPITVVNRCRKADGSDEMVEGVARVMPRSNGSELQVSFAPAWLRSLLPWSWSDFWILRVDDDYRSALVGSPDRRHLWLLSRTPRLSGSDYQRLVEHAQAQGYDTGRITLTRQRM